MLRPRPVARLVSLALALGLLALPHPARADTEGKRGRIMRLRINTPSSDDHPSYLGSITVKLGSGELVEYRWGGSSCPSQKLTDPQIELLRTAFVERNRTRLLPLYTMGEGAGTRCLVGFELIAG
ncbi:MAG: hypothetical protein KDK70_37350 [Myxococcales bacterium]|nr:hypothetical protein [Myxococcales bacterium]